MYLSNCAANLKYVPLARLLSSGPGGMKKERNPTLQSSLEGTNCEQEQEVLVLFCHQDTFYQLHIYCISVLLIQMITFTDI